MPDRPIALVTGAAKGLGLEIARGLAERGQRVYLSGRSHERARAAAAPLVAAGLDVRPLTLDVEDGPSIEAAATRISREATRLDVLVNNAAVLLDEPYDALDVPLDLVRRTLEVDLVGPWAVLQAFAPLLRRSRAARVVNVSSSAGSLHDLAAGAAPGAWGPPAYCTAKAAAQRPDDPGGARVRGGTRARQRLLPRLAAHRHGRSGRRALGGAGRRHPAVAGHAPRRRSHRGLLRGAHAVPVVSRSRPRRSWR